MHRRVVPFGPAGRKKMLAKPKCFRRLSQNKQHANPSVVFTRSSSRRSPCTRCLSPLPSSAPSHGPPRVPDSGDDLGRKRGEGGKRGGFVATGKPHILFCVRGKRAGPRPARTRRDGLHALGSPHVLFRTAPFRFFNAGPLRHITAHENQTSDHSHCSLFAAFRDDCTVRKKMATTVNLHGSRTRRTVGNGTTRSCAP